MWSQKWGCIIVISMKWGLLNIDNIVCIHKNSYLNLNEMEMVSLPIDVFLP